MVDNERGEERYTGKRHDERVVDIATKTIEITVAGCGENEVERRLADLMSVDVWFGDLLL